MFSGFPASGTGLAHHVSTPFIRFRPGSALVLKGLTDIPGVLVGHATDPEALTGCTAILFPDGAVAGVDIRGSATGSQELDVLNPLHLTPRIHGICLAGGSAFGLEAASGVRNWLGEHGIGFDTRYAKVPLVPSAILYDLGIGKPNVRPTREMGYSAAGAATTDPVVEGCVGAGTGATVGKALGMDHAMKGGIGSASMAIGSKLKIAALAAVNPFGDILQPRSRTIVAGARKSSDTRIFADTAELLKTRAATSAFSNTCLVVIVTNARLTKVQATKLAQLGQQGMVEAISPVSTVYDGDIVFAASAGNEECDLTSLGIAAAEVVAESIVRGVLSAWTAGGVPGLAPAPKLTAKPPRAG